VRSRNHRLQTDSDSQQNNRADHGSPRAGLNHVRFQGRKASVTGNPPQARRFVLPASSRAKRIPEPAHPHNADLPRMTRASHPGYARPNNEGEIAP
jgi:hypothetical protein